MYQARLLALSCAQCLDMPAVVEGVLLTLHPPLLLPCFPRRALCPLGPLASSYLLPVRPFDDDLDLEGPFLPEHDGVSLQALTGVSPPAAQPISHILTQARTASDSHVFTYRCTVLTPWFMDPNMQTNACIHRPVSIIQSHLGAKAPGHTC